MNRFLNSAEILLFRSKPLNNFTLKSNKFRNLQLAKMVNTLSIEELKQRSTQATDLIEKLKKQIEQIKLQTTPAYMAEKVKTLQNENEKLKQEVELLKKELEAAEAARGSRKNKYFNYLKIYDRNLILNIFLEPVVAAEPAKPKAEAKQQPAKQAETKPKEAKQKEAKPAEAKPAKQQESKKAPVEDLTNVDISKLDLRVGKIVKCEKHPDAESLYVEQIDLGEGKLRNVCSGLVKFIPLEDVNNMFIFKNFNLKSKIKLKFFKDAK